MANVKLKSRVEWKEPPRKSFFETLKNSLSLLFGYLETTFAIVLILTSAYAIYWLFFAYKYLQIPIIAILAVGLGIFGFRYIQPSDKTNYMVSRDIPYDYWRYDAINDLIDTRMEFNHFFNSGDLGFTQKEKTNLLNNIKETLQTEANKQYLTELQNSIKESLKNEAFADQFNNTRKRLAQETELLGNRGSLNLILGIFTTAAGVAVLGYSVIKTPTYVDIPQTLAYFVPRISLVLLIEIFAYFFLKLYKQSLGEI